MQQLSQHERRPDENRPTDHSPLFDGNDDDETGDDEQDEPYEQRTDHTPNDSRVNSMPSASTTKDDKSNQSNESNERNERNQSTESNESLASASVDSNASASVDSNASASVDSNASASVDSSNAFSSRSTRHKSQTPFRTAKSAQHAQHAQQTIKRTNTGDTTKPPSNTDVSPVALTQPSQQLHRKLVTARGVLQQVQLDYQRCSRLSADYRNKHRQQMEMYLTMNKLLFLWHKGSSADGNMSSELLRLVQNANIMPDDELRALRRANDQVMKEVYDETAKIDQEYFSPNNPIFQDLTDDQQREVMQNKKMAHQLLKKRLDTMKDVRERGADDNNDKRYRLAFSNSYFGEKGDLVNTVWGTDDMVNIRQASDTFQSLFDDNSTMNWFNVRLFSMLEPVLRASEAQMIAKGVMLLQNAVYPTELNSIASCTGYLAHLVQQDTRTPPTQVTNIMPFVRQHPLLFLGDKDDEEAKCLEWLQLTKELFDKELDKMFEGVANGVTVVRMRGSVVQGTKLQLSNPATSAMVLYIQKTGDIPHHRVPLVMDDEDTKVCFIPNVYTYNNQLREREQLLLVRAVDELAETSKQTIAHHYLAVAGCVQHRAEAVYQLVWRACVESGKSYPVMPSLFFVSGLDNEQMTHSELAFWYNESTLTTHIKKISNELVDPDYDDRFHIKGNFRELDEDGDSFKTWREYFARDTRVFLNMEDACNERTTTTTSAVNDAWMAHMCANVSSIHESTLRQEDAISEYCMRLFLCIVKNDTNWLDVRSNPGVTEQTHIIDEKLHHEVYFDTNGDWYNLHGAFLVALYEQLNKTRTCVFAPNSETTKPSEVFEDIENALDMHMELLEHMVVNGLHTKAHRIYNKAFFDKTKKHNGKIIFCWRTFKSVFGAPQLSAWKRDVDPAGVARQLKQTLCLDLVELEDHTRKLDPRVVFDCVDIVHDRAYGRSTDNNENAIVSPSHVHLVRLMLWNLGVWNIALNTDGYAKQLEEHVDTLIANGHHPFDSELTVEDVVYGHASPLLVARLFVLCARFAKFSPVERETHFGTFKRAYDVVVINIRHPVFMGMLLKFRGHFFHTPNVHYLYKLWYMVDVGMWNQNAYMWNHLIEYALGVEFVGNSQLFAGRNYFEEFKLMTEVTKEVNQMSDSDIVAMRRTLKDTFVSEMPANPVPQTNTEKQAQQTRKRALRRRDGDDVGEVADVDSVDSVRERDGADLSRED
jgi:hypothetical protein